MTRREHLLAILAEECAEVSQRVTKILRFGINEKQPGQDKTNRARLVDELNDLRAAVQMLEDEGVLPAIIDHASIQERKLRIAEKREKVEKYLRYSASLGLVTGSLRSRRRPAKDSKHG